MIFSGLRTKLILSMLPSRIPESLHSSKRRPKGSPLTFMKHALTESRGEGRLQNLKRYARAGPFASLRLVLQVFLLPAAL